MEARSDHLDGGRQETLRILTAAAATWRESHARWPDERSLQSGLRSLLS